MIEIIPAIDIIDGSCVRLTQGDYTQKKVYNQNPLEVAKQFEDAGIKRLHLVDLDGAKQHHIVNHKVLVDICSKTNLKVDFGGGIKSDEDIQKAFDCGASQITAGSIAVKNKELTLKWLQKYGADKIILGADVMNNKIAIQGWQSTTEIDIFSFLSEYLSVGITQVICTDISKDGLLEGTSLELYNDIIHKFAEIKLIASGGVTHIDEIVKLNDMNVYGVIIGKAIYEGKIGINELADFVSKNE